MHLVGLLLALLHRSYWRGDTLCEHGSLQHFLNLIEPGLGPRLLLCERLLDKTGNVCPDPIKHRSGFAGKCFMRFRQLLNRFLEVGDLALVFLPLLLAWSALAPILLWSPSWQRWPVVAG